MSWATRRQLIIFGIIALLLLGVLLYLGYVFFYKAPICTDGKQDGKEQGIDCGGPCPYLCSAAEVPLTVRFAQPVSPESNRTDLIAYIDNSNSNAGAETATYSLSFYGPKGSLVTQTTGTITVPPSSTEPLYVPRAYVGTHLVGQAFLSISTSSVKWLRTMPKPVVPLPSSITILDGQTPRVTATLKNQLATPIKNVKIVATVFDASNNAIAASQTVVPSIAAQGSVPLVFTWNEPFSAPPARVEILPAYGS